MEPLHKLRERQESIHTFVCVCVCARARAAPVGYLWELFMNFWPSGNRSIVLDSPLTHQVGVPSIFDILSPPCPPCPPVRPSVQSSPDSESRLYHNILQRYSSPPLTDQSGWQQNIQYFDVFLTLNLEFVLQSKCRDETRSD